MMRDYMKALFYRFETTSGAEYLDRKIKRTYRQISRYWMSQSGNCS